MCGSTYHETSSNNNTKQFASNYEFYDQFAITITPQHNTTIFVFQNSL